MIDLAIEALGGMDCPVVRCGVCKRRIEQADRGFVAWTPGEGQLQTAHKACVPRDGPDVLSMELKTFLVHLAMNSGINAEAFLGEAQSD